MLSTIMLLGTLTGILLGVGWLLGGLSGLAVAVVFSLVINFFAYWYSDRIVLKMYRAKPLNDSKISSMVERLAKEARIPRPRLYYLETDVPNAFATGRNPKHSAVAVTKGLMGLEDDEMEGVLSHELGHIRNRDTLVSTMAATIAGAISFLAQIGYFSMFGSRGREGGNLAGLLLIVVFAPLAALLVRLAISRGREYKADYFGALLTKRPGALSSALGKISSYAQAHPIRGNAATSHMWIINPFNADSFTGLFSTHPPVGERIKRLERMRTE